MFYGLAENEKWFKERINLFVALAPCVKITNSKSSYIQILAKMEGVLEGGAASLGIKEIFGKGWEAHLKRFENMLPSEFAGTSDIKQLDDVSNPLMDSANKTKIFKGHFPHGASVKSLSHYGQILNADAFLKFDYHDSKKNFEKYG